MNTDKIYAEAVANEYSIKTSRKVISLAEARQMGKTPCKDRSVCGRYHILIIKYTRLDFDFRYILFCRYRLQIVRAGSLCHRCNWHGSITYHLYKGA